MTTALRQTAIDRLEAARTALVPVRDAIAAALDPSDPELAVETYSEARRNVSSYLNGSLSVIDAALAQLRPPPLSPGAPQ